MIRTDDQDGVVVRTLDRPDKRNARTPGMLAELAANAKEAGERARAVVVAGAGDVFCSGFDLTMCREDPPALAAMLAGLFEAVMELRSGRAPVVIAAQGAAIAGGCALLGGADFVISNIGATFGYPVARLGISPAVTAPFLAACIGEAAARTLLLEGSLIDGPAALSMGLLSECVATPDLVMPRAVQLAHALAAKPPGGVAATRRWLGELDGTTDRARMRRGLEASLALVGGAEQNERLAAMWKREDAKRGAGSSQ